jgi:Flp pilus assembly CpaE family ATPase
MLEGLRDGGYNLERFHLICNRMDKESAHLEINHVEETLKKKVAHAIPEDWKTASSAINMGLTLKEYAPKSKLRNSIHELAKLLASPESAALATAGAGGGGLFSRIFSGG